MPFEEENDIKWRFANQLPASLASAKNVIDARSDIDRAIAVELICLAARTVPGGRHLNHNPLLDPDAVTTSDKVIPRGAD
jgi:hypothetical protein